MKISTIYEDAAFTDSVVPEGYLLVFIGYSTGAAGGDIVKRYKNHNGEFGTLAGATAGMTDEEANTLITTSTTASEQGAEEVAAILVSSTAISTQLDSIIGE